MKIPVSKLLFFVAVVPLLGACGDQAAQKDAGQAEKKSLGILIVTRPVVKRDLSVWLESVGRIRSKVAPTLAAEIEGRIVTVAADTGDKVEKGRLLAETDTTALQLDQRAAVADLKRLLTRIANEQRRVNRYVMADMVNEITPESEGARAILDVAVRRGHSTS